MKKSGAVRRNERRWYENGDYAVLTKHPLGLPVLVEVTGMTGDTPQGEVIYRVVEAVTRLCYPASDRSMRPVRDRAEVDALLARARAAV